MDTSHAGRPPPGLTDPGEYEVHWCRNYPTEDVPFGSWSPGTQARLDAARSVEELIETWEDLAGTSEVDGIGGAEYRHALAHLYARHPPGGQHSRTQRKAVNSAWDERRRRAEMVRDADERGIPLLDDPPPGLSIQVTRPDGTRTRLRHGNLDTARWLYPSADVDLVRDDGSVVLGDVTRTLRRLPEANEPAWATFSSTLAAAEAAIGRGENSAGHRTASREIRSPEPEAGA